MSDELEHQPDLSHLPRRDAGYSLTEVLVAIVLMSVAIAPILVSAAVSVRTSAQSRTLARMETVLANAADRVNRASEGCDYSVYVQAAVLAEQWQPSQFTVSYQHYTPAASATSPGTWEAGACVDGVRTPGLVQLVTIGITTPDGNSVRTIQVVKSDV